MTWRDVRPRPSRRLAVASGLGATLAVAGNVLWRLGRAQRRAAALAPSTRDHDAVVPPDGRASTGTSTVGEALGEPLRLVVLGDSAADGFGIADPAEAFPRQLAHRIARMRGARVQVRSWAVSGARTADLADNQVPVLPGVQPDVVVASCGVNDVVHRTPIDEVEAATERLLGGIRAAAPDADVVLVGCPDLSGAPGIAWPLSLAVRRRSRRVAAVQAAVAARLGEAFAPLEPTPAPDLFGQDGFHPGPEAQSLMADAAVAAMPRRV